MRKMISVGLLLACGMFALAACNGDNGNKAEKQRSDAVHQRADTFQRAQDAVPTPKTENFPLRRTLAEMTKRQDMVNHPWYVYILGENGNAIGYYVAKTVPINACDFLSSTEDVHYDDEGNFITTAPSLDGIFYGGSGSASGCDAWVFLDQSTNALVQIRGVNFFTADAPLRIDAQPITVSK